MSTTPPPFGRRGVRAPPAIAPRLEPKPNSSQTSDFAVSPEYVRRSRGDAAPASGFDLADLLFSFDGRIPRLKYWLVQIGLFVVLRLVTFISNSLSGSMKAAEAAHTVSAPLLVTGLVGIFVVLAMLAVAIWVGLAVTVKRWHDRGKSGFWAFLGVVPMVGWLWQFVECGCLEGTLGANAYGPSPKGITGVAYGDMLAETFS